MTAIAQQLIIPSVIGQTWSEVEAKLIWLEGRTPWAHLDVMDGRFAETVSWRTPSDLDFLSGQLKLEVHLMVQSPENTLADWARVADRIIVHAEAAGDLNGLVDAFTGQGSELGLALLLPTPLAALESVLPRLKFIHLMSVEKIGYHGQPFAEAILDKIKALRTAAPTAIISVDGGLKADNLPAVWAAGADRAVVGGAIWHSPDPAKALEQLLDQWPPKSG